MTQSVDLRIGEIVKTAFSGNEKFEVYDIRFIYSQREDSTTVEFKLNAIGKEELKTAWLNREDLTPAVWGE